jgi:hypothetical protein
MAYKSPIDLATLGGLSGNPLEAMRMAQQQRSDLRTSEMAQSMGYEPQIGDPGYGKSSMAPSAQINQPAQAVGAPTAGGVMTGDINSSSVANPFDRLMKWVMLLLCLSQALVTLLLKCTEHL